LWIKPARVSCTDVNAELTAVAAAAAVSATTTLRSTNTQCCGGNFKPSVVGLRLPARPPACSLSHRHAKAKAPLPAAPSFRPPVADRSVANLRRVAGLTEPAALVIPMGTRPPRHVETRPCTSRLLLLRHVTNRTYCQRQLSSRVPRLSNRTGRCQIDAD